jgi:hypothetical protein
MYEDYEDSRPVTTAEAVREWAWVVGAERLDQQWLLSDYDTWERNPHYAGPDQRHPEDYDYDEEPYMDPIEADAQVLASAGMGTDEDYGIFDSGDGWYE